MNIKFFTNHVRSVEPLFVNFKIKSSDQLLFEKTINVQDTINVVDATFNLLNFNEQVVVADISTNNNSIIHNPLIINTIELDNFYSQGKITYSAKQNFNTEFLNYADKNDIFLDLTTNDNNCLNFTGSLVYKFVWPFFKNVQTIA
jgi:hypothetical protein